MRWLHVPHWARPHWWMGSAWITSQFIISQTCAHNNNKQVIIISSMLPSSMSSSSSLADPTIINLIIFLFFIHWAVGCTRAWDQAPGQWRPRARESEEHRSSLTLKSSWRSFFFLSFFLLWLMFLLFKSWLFDFFFFIFTTPYGCHYDSD